jgi:hypothetical protein
MKNNKIKQLMERGLSHKLLSTMNEGQINQLHKMMVGEQVQEMPTKKSYQVGPDGGNLPAAPKGYNVKKTTTGDVIATPNESELEEDADLDDSTEKSSGFDPFAGNSVGNDDGPSRNAKAYDGMGMMEEKKDGPNPYSICHSQVGPKKSRKWERCVREIKKQIEEGKNPYLPIMEAALAKMVERHISPKMTKSELINTLSEQGIISRPFKNSMMGFVGHDELDKPVEKMYISKKETMEQGTKTAPAPTRVKPGTKEKEKPGKMDPFKNPKHQPKPKAEKMDEQGTKTAPAPTRVKPGTKEKPNTSDPFKNPKHQPKPKASTEAPKMGTVKIPDYLEFDQLKIDFKNQ